MTIIYPRDGSDDLLVRLPIEIAKLPLATFVGIEVEPERAIHTAVVRADDEEDVRVDQLGRAVGEARGGADRSDQLVKRPPLDGTAPGCPSLQGFPGTSRIAVPAEARSFLAPG